jgi:hypothetical protein
MLSIAALGSSISFDCLKTDDIFIKKIKTYIIYAGIALYCLFISLASVEYILQRNPMWIVSPNATIDPMQIVLFSFDQWRADDEIGVIGKPNTSATMQGPFALYSLYDSSAWEDETRPIIDFKTDAQGFRNDEEIETADLVVLGDSFTHGAFVNRNEIWSSQFAERLKINECNLGQSAFSPQQSSLVLNQYGFSRSPKLVIYQLFYGNDFDDAVQFNRWQQSGKPYVQFIRDQLGEMPQLWMTWQWFQNHYLAQKTKTGWAPIECEIGDKSVAFGFSPPGAFLYQKQESIRSNPGFSLTVETIDEMAQECETRGIKFLVFAVPTKVSIYASQIKDHEQQNRFLEQQGIKENLNFDEARERMKNLPFLFSQEMSRREIDFMDLTQAMIEESNTSLLYYPFDTHWNPNGHLVATNQLQASISDLKLLNYD